MTRDEVLRLAPDALERLCRFSVCRGVGPGGQKRNRTESAVHALCPLLGISAYDDATRSQHQNKARALAKLRLAIALQVRQASPAPWDGPVPGLRSPDRPRWLARAFDCLEEAEYRISEAAAALGCGTARLGRELARDPAAWQLLNQRRLQRGLPPLKDDR